MLSEPRNGTGNAMRATAVALISVDGMLLLATLWFVLVKPNVDFPCESGLGPGREVSPSTKISYCIALWPRWAPGGVVYASGSTEGDRIAIPPRGIMYPGITMVREGATLVVNGERLALGQAFTASRWVPSLNPWLIPTTRIRVAAGSPFKDIIFVEGEISEGWIPGPIGPIILILAPWILIRGHRGKTPGA